MPTNREIMRDSYDAFARGDMEAVLAVHDPGIVWMEAENVLYADRNPYIGPQQVAEGLFARIVRDFDGFHIQLDQLVHDGDTVVALGRYHGTWKATGRTADAQFVHVWTLRDGRITHFQQYTDTLQFARVTGALDAAVTAGAGGLSPAGAPSAALAAR